MSDVEVRATTPGDLIVLADVLVEVYQADGYPVEGVDNPRAWLQLSDPVGQWTALIDGQPVGHVALLRPGPEDQAPRLLVDYGVPLSEMAVLGRLFVDPDARGKSVARKLLATAENAAIDGSLVPVLEVLDKDAAAILIYESRGWRRLSEVQHT